MSTHDAHFVRDRRADWIGNMDDAEKKQILERYYFNAKNPAAFAGARKLLSALDKKYPGVFTADFVQQRLNDKDAYSLPKLRKHSLKTTSMRVTAIGEQLDIDLLSMTILADDNDGVRFLLCHRYIIKKSVGAAAKNKTAKVVLSAMKDILQDISPTNIKKIHADKGSEFSNLKSTRRTKAFIFSLRIIRQKSNFIRRFHRTLKEKLYRMMRHQKKKKLVANEAP